MTNVDKLFYKKTCLCIPIVLLIISRIRICKLLDLKVYYLQSLLKHHCISIDCSKRSFYNHKVFLTNERKKVIKMRKHELNILRTMK